MSEARYVCAAAYHQKDQAQKGIFLDGIAEQKIYNVARTTNSCRLYRLYPQNRKAKGQQMKVSDSQWKGSKAEMSKEQCIVFIFCV